MFGRRKDGKRVKGMDIIDQIEPFFMPMRIDAVNYAKVKVNCESLDKFIAEENKKGNNSIGYMHIVIASLVRMFYLREKQNRFVMNDIIYQRNGIYISMDIKKKLTDDGEIVTLKFPFKGTENLYEVQKIIDDEIKKNLDEGAAHTTTKNAGKLTKMPAWLLRFAMRLIRFFDRHGMFTGWFLKASPFHTSCFVTNLKSIKLNYVYHHLYNFGTTSMFVSMGKEQNEPVVLEDNSLGVAKIMTLGFSLDERIADGVYMGKSLRMLERFMKNPTILLDNAPEKEQPAKKKRKDKKKKEKKSK